VRQAQTTLFGDGQMGHVADLPLGFSYRAEAITPAEERDLVERFSRLPFRPFDFHGWLGKRRVVSYGWRYNYSAAALQPAEAMPAFLRPLRDRVAGLAGLPADSLQHALITEYAIGAGIGWHRDKAAFGEVLAVSFLSACRLRLRRREDAEKGKTWQRRSIEIAPRSLYRLSGPARRDWEHSVPPVAPVDALRYAVTFRTLATT
jgi:alkylated DNA repair dioxygenase AlkB